MVKGAGEGDGNRKNLPSTLKVHIFPPPPTLLRFRAAPAEDGSSQARDRI